MGFFKKKGAEKPVEIETPANEVTDTDFFTSEEDLSAPKTEQEDFDTNSELDDFDLTDTPEEEEESSGYKGLTGEEVISALHRSDKVKNTVIGALGGMSDKMNDLTMASIAEAFTETQYGIRAKTIAFFGAGGGVGTSSMLLEVAKRVADKHKRVLLIDLNVIGPIDELVLRSPIKNKREDLLTLLGRNSDLSNTIVQTLSGVSTVGFRNRGVDTRASVDSAIYGKAYDTLIQEVSAGYDFIFVDCGHDISYYLAVNALYRADAGYIVTDGGLSSIQYLGSLRTCFRYFGIISSSYGVISNKNTRSITSVLSDMDYRYAGAVPYLLSIKNANLQGKTLGNDFVYAESGAVAGAKQTFDALAEEVVTALVRPITDDERKQEMEFDREAKAKEGEAE